MPNNENADIIGAGAVAPVPDAKDVMGERMGALETAISVQGEQMQRMHNDFVEAFRQVAATSNAPVGRPADDPGVNDMSNEQLVEHITSSVIGAVAENVQQQVTPVRNEVVAGRKAQRLKELREVLPDVGDQIEAMTKLEQDIATGQLDPTDPLVLYATVKAQQFLEKAQQGPAPGQVEPDAPGGHSPEAPSSVGQGGRRTVGNGEGDDSDEARSQQPFSCDRVRSAIDAAVADADPAVREAWESLGEE